MIHLHTTMRAMEAGAQIPRDMFPQEAIEDGCARANSRGRYTRLTPQEAEIQSGEDCPGLRLLSPDLVRREDYFRMRDHRTNLMMDPRGHNIAGAVTPSATVYRESHFVFAGSYEQPRSPAEILMEQENESSKEYRYVLGTMVRLLNTLLPLTHSSTPTI